MLTPRRVTESRILEQEVFQNRGRIIACIFLVITDILNYLQNYSLLVSTQLVLLM